MDEKKLLQQAMSNKGLELSIATLFAIIVAGLYAWFYPYIAGPSAVFVMVICVFLIVLAFVTAVKG